MQTQQPVWKLVAQLGDVNPINYGGLFVYEDTTGVYPPEAEKLISPDDDNGTWEVRRLSLSPCTFINGVLSDNKFHPTHPAWFADKLDSLAEFAGYAGTNDLIEAFCNGSTADKAQAWDSIGAYFGYDNLDSYPLYFSREEITARYADELAK